MAIVFPASPSVNETFTAGSITYKWDGDKWIGLGVTPADRLVEGSNSLEITAANELQWTGGNVGIGIDPVRPLHLHNASGSIFLVSGLVPQIRFNSDSADGVDNERGIIGLATGAGQFMANAVSGDLVIRSETGNSILFGNGTTEKVRIGAGGAGQIGIGTTPTTNAALDINQGYYSIMYGAVNGANGGRSDNTNKEGRIVQYHRDNEEEPLGAIVTFSQSTAGNVYIGGGSSLVNAATETALFAAANTTTTGGTKILSATTDGILVNAGDLKLGTEAPTPPASGVPDNTLFIGRRSKQYTVSTTTTLDGSGNGTFDLGRIFHNDDESMELFMSICRNDNTNFSTHYCKAYCQKVRGTGMSNFFIDRQDGAAAGFSVSSLSAGTAQGVIGHGTLVNVTGGAGGVIYRITALVTGVSKNGLH